MYPFGEEYGDTAADNIDPHFDDNPNIKINYFGSVYTDVQVLHVFFSRWLIIAPPVDPPEVDATDQCVYDMCIVCWLIVMDLRIEF